MLNSEEIYVVSGGTSSLDLDVNAAKSIAIINKENHNNNKTTYSLSFIVFAKTDKEALNAVRLILNSDLNKSKGKFEHVSFIPYRITNCTNKSIVDELVYNQNHNKTKSDNIISKLMSKQLPVVYKDITTGCYNIFYKYISQLNRYKSIKSVKIFTINQCDTYSHPVNNISIDESNQVIFVITIFSFSLTVQVLFTTMQYFTKNMVFLLIIYTINLTQDILINYLKKQIKI